MEMNRDVLCKVESAEGEKETGSERKKGRVVCRGEMSETEEESSRSIAQRYISHAKKKGDETESSNNAFSQSTLSVLFNLVTTSLPLVQLVWDYLPLAFRLPSRFISLYYRALKLRKRTCEPSRVNPA